MGHVHTLGDASPEAKAIIHLGATSCQVTSTIPISFSIETHLKLVRDKLVGAIDVLATFADRWRLAVSRLHPFSTRAARHRRQGADLMVL